MPTISQYITGCARSSAAKDVRCPDVAQATSSRILRASGWKWALASDALGAVHAGTLEFTFSIIWNCFGHMLTNIGPLHWMLSDFAQYLWQIAALQAW